jgi:hypothetical protein
MLLGHCSPFSWEFIRGLLDEVRDEFRTTSGSEAVENCTAVLLQPKSWVLTLSLPVWLAECVPVNISDECKRRMAKIQILLACFYKIYDDTIDEGIQTGPEGANIIFLLPLVWRAQDQLGHFFPRNHPFWKQMEKLISQQCAASVWELSHRTGNPYYLDETFLLMLQRKAALHRWPAIAVPHIADKSSEIDRLDAISESLFLVLQLLDDLADFPHDYKTKQPNAVIAASSSPERPSNEAIDRVEDIIHEHLYVLENETRLSKPHYFGRFLQCLCVSTADMAGRAREYVEVANLTQLFDVSA